MSIIIALIGPIEYWWDVPEEPDRFNSVPAAEYRQYRNDLNDFLVSKGYLVFRPHEAFKGEWDERAQAFNDAMVQIADIVVCMRPLGIPGKGTDHEINLALLAGKVVVNAPPDTEFDILDKHLRMIASTP